MTEDEIDLPLPDRPAFRDVLERIVRETESPMDTDGQTVMERICRAVTGKALTGDLKAFEIMRDMLDGKPSDKPKPEPAVIAWEEG